MQKIVIDTNVLVSSIIQKSYPHFILHELWINDKIRLCISPELIAEYYDVLRRRKFARYADFFIAAEMLLTDIDTKALLFHPKIKVKLLRDKDDNKLLELSESCHADYLITGNTNDFTFSRHKQTKIVMPREYWEVYRNK